MKRFLTFVCLTLFPIAVASAAPTSRCLEPSETVARIDCLVGDSTLGPDTLEALADALPTDPAAVAEAADRLNKATRGADGSSRARLFDLQAQALSALGKAAEAAQAYDRALASDDGVRSIVWYEGKREVASTALDTGHGLLVRAGIAKIEAGNPGNARELLGRAVNLGAGEEARAALERAGGAPVSGEEVQVLAGRNWFEPFPDLEVPMYGGQRFVTSEKRGRVVLFDFWASWCQPCVRELPFIQQLHEAKQDEGLDVLAVNFQEPPDEAMAFAQGLGINLPLGIATAEMERAFRLVQMPTVVIADRLGRIRARFEGYEEGINDAILDKVQELLDEPEEQATELGRVVQGAGRFQVAWMRNASRRVEGLAVIHDPGKEPSIAVTMSRAFHVFAWDGRLLEEYGASQNSGRIRSLDDETGGLTQMFSFRPGGRDVAHYDRVNGKRNIWQAPSPIFEIATAVGSQGTPELLLATMDGLYAVDRDGAEPQRIDGLTRASDVRRQGTSWIAIDPGVRVAQSADPAASGPRVAADSWRIVPANGDRYGVVGFGAVAIAVGNFFDPERSMVALALDTGQVVIVDPASGEVEFRAEWEGASDLAAGDIDGDGLDDLVVADARGLIVLYAVPRAAQRQARASSPN